MNTNDESVKKALDDLFGDNIEEKTITIEDFDKTMSATNSFTVAELDKALNKGNDTVLEEINVEEPKTDDIAEVTINIDDIPVMEEVESTNQDNNVQINTDDIAEFGGTVNESKNAETIEKSDKQDEDLDKEVERIIRENPEDPINYKKIIIFIIIGFVLGFLVVFLITNYMNNQEKSVNCSYEVSDNGYENTNEYKITYTGNKISKIYGIYKYKAKNEEYEKQIDYIKDEKIPVIINSNGMPGFTYLYSIGTDFIEIESNLEFDKMDFKVVDKTNWDAQPISYFKFNSKTKFKDLKTYFEKNAYKCVATD